MIIIQIIVFLFHANILRKTSNENSNSIRIATVNNNKYIKDNICKFDSFNSDLPLSTFLEESYWIYYKENVPNSLYDSYRNEYGIFRRKSCIYMMLKPEDTIKCLNNKNILLLGDSTSWELKNKIHDDLSFICKESKQCSYIVHNFENRDYSKYTYYMIDYWQNSTIRYVDKLNNINIYIKFHEPYIENRLGSYIFLPKYMRDEINEKWEKYNNYTINATSKRWKQIAPFLTMQFDGNMRNKTVPLTYLVNAAWIEVMHSKNGTSMDEYVDIHLKRVRTYLKDANIIIYSMQLHDLAFWKFFGWVLEEFGDPLSFNYIEYRTITLNNTLNIFHQYKNIKYIFFWSSQKPNSDTGDCMFLMDDYDRFHYNTIKILKEVLHSNMIYIDTHNVTFGEEKKHGRAYHDGGGCHFSNGNVTKVVGHMFGKIVKNAMCQYPII